MADGTAPFRRLLGVASSLAGSYLVTSVIGVVFWTVATRLFAPEAVGVGAAALSAMTTAAIIGGVGLGTLLLGELPQLTPLGRAQLARAALSAVAFFSLLLGLAWAAASRGLGSALRPITTSPPTVILFAAGVVLTAVTAVFDEATLSSGRSSVQLVRNVVASVAKLVALPLVVVGGGRSGMALYGAWVVGIVCSVPLMYPLVRIPRSLRGSQGTARARAPGVVLLLRQRARGAAEHHVVNLGLQIPMMLLPVLAAVVTSPTETAYFATARLAATFLFMFPFALALALFATARRSAGDVALTMRRTLPGGLALSAALVLVTEVAAEPVLSIFGREYAAQAAGQLRILAFAGMAFVVKDHYIALRRIEGRVARATPIVLVGVALEVILALAGGRIGGIRGLCFGWVLATACEALIVTPALTVAFRGYRRKGRHRRRRRTHHPEQKTTKSMRRTGFGSPIGLPDGVGRSPSDTGAG